MCKRIVAIAIVFLIAIGGAVNVAADTAASSSVGIIGVSSNIAGMAGNVIDDKNVKVSKAEAKQISIELLKKYFGLEIDEKKYQGTVQLAPNYEINNSYTWQFNWSMSNSTMYSHISMEIDASTGRLNGFNRSESYRNQEQVVVADITKEQAHKLAEEFLEKINPEEYKQTKLEDYGNDIIYSGRIRPNYSFNFIREANGLRYPSNYIMVGVDGTNGTIVSYRTNWEYDISLPAAERLIEKEKALAIYKERISMNLSYIPMRNITTRYMAPTEVKLVYNPDFLNGILIDAQTGEPISYNGEKTDNLKKRDITQEQKNKLVAGKPKPSGGTGEMSSDEAEAFADSLAKEIFGAGYKAGNLNYSENEIWPEGSRKTWTAEVMEDKPEAIQGVGNISIDSTTGEILNIGRYVFEDWYGKEYERKITWEQAYDKAVELLGRYYSHKLGDIRTEQVYRENMYQVNGKMIPDRMIYFNFPRLVNGIMYGNDSINISIDTETGQVNDMNYNWSTILSFPSPEGVIGKEKAKELYFKEYDAEPIYFEYKKKINENEYKQDHKIVYTLKQKQSRSYSGNIDAFTGKFINYDGQEIVPGKNNFSEMIKGNSAEKELSILAFQGIIDTNSFKPDNDITYMELIKMLVNAKGYRPYTARGTEELLFKNVSKKDENYLYLLEAVRYGIIENKPVELKLDAKVTREQMAELVVKLLKYDKLARVKDIFVLGFKDSDMISSELKGHVAIVKGLGIMDGRSEMFGPKESLKMQEAALIIYRALDSMREIK